MSWWRQWRGSVVRSRSDPSPRAVWQLWAGQEPAAHTRLCISLLTKVSSHLPLHMEIFWSSDRSQSWWIKACAVYLPWHLSIWSSWVCVLSFVCANGSFLKKYMGCFTSNMSIIPGVLHPLDFPFISMVVAGLVQYVFAHVTALLIGRHGRGEGPGASGPVSTSLAPLWYHIASNYFLTLDAKCSLSCGSSDDKFN